MEVAKKKKKHDDIKTGETGGAPRNEKPMKLSELKRKIKEEKYLRKIQKLEKEMSEKVERETVPDDNHESSGVQWSSPTISIAVPGSILDNAQSVELRTYLGGQIARAACVFKVNEVIVFDDLADTGSVKMVEVEEEIYGVKSARRCCVQLARILLYLECPQYLRKDYFPLHKDLAYAGLLNPLDAPHHLRQDDEFPYREGIVTTLPAKSGRSVVNAGMRKSVMIDRVLIPGLRVTVKLKDEGASKKMHGTVVSPSEPTNKTGVYWGYNVRISPSLSKIKLNSPYEDGYDVVIGTSDKGKSVDDIDQGCFANCRHMLIVFGGLEGLEAALENDEEMNENPSDFFDYYLNTCPDQGSRTIRTEEAILISLAALRTKIIKK